MPQPDVEFHRQKLAVMMRRLEALVSDYASRRLTSIADAQRWRPAPALAQVLLARAWLRGVASPADLPGLQLRAILSDESDAKSNPTARCTPWIDFLNRTSPWHEEFRDALRKMLRTPQGDAQNFGLADVSQVIGAVLRLVNTFKFDQIPPERIQIGVTQFDKVREIIKQTDGSLTRIVRIECDQIRSRAEILGKNLRGRSIRAHLARIDEVVESVSTHLLGTAPDRIREWKANYNQLKPRLEAKADAGVQDLLIQSTDPDGLPSSNAQLLEWLARAPVQDLEDFRGLSHIGEQTVASLLSPVEDCIREGRGSASLDDIRRVGQRLRDAARSSNPKNEAP
jgi:hypothetical protein